MRSARWIAVVASLSAAGCLWLFPIEKKDEAKSSVTGSAGSIDPTGTGGAGGAGGSTQVGDGSMPECTKNADCLEAQSVRHANECVQLASDDCLVVLGKWEDDNAIVIGAYAPELVATPAEGQAIYNYDLAITQLNMNGGLPDKNGVKHPLAAVVCNNDPTVKNEAVPDPELYHRTLAHLVDKVGVTAILADLPPDTLEDDYKQTQDRIFYLSPGPANNRLHDLADNGLVWTMLGPPKDLAPGYGDLVHRIETLITGKIEPTATVVRVATVLNDDPNEPNHQLFGELYEAVKPKLFFNGKYATEQMGTNYQEFHLSMAGADAGTSAAVGDAINEYAPHIVLSMTGRDFTRPTNPVGVAREMIEKVHAGTGRDLWLDHTYPFFIGSPVNAAATNDFTILLSGQNAIRYPTLYQRILGITIAGADDRALYQDYVKTLRTFHQGAFEGFENYYDAVYYLAYAIYGAGVSPLTAPKISTGMNSLSNGTPEKVGLAGIDSVLKELGEVGSVLLNGVSGSQFDNKGARIDKAGLYCFSSVSGGTAAPLARQPAAIFDPDKAMWTVLYECVTGL